MKNPKGNQKIDLPRSYSGSRHSWLHDKQPLIDKLPYFWMRDPLKYLFGTQKNTFTGMYEWRLVSHYSNRDLFYSLFWFFFFLGLLIAAAILLNFWNGMYYGFYMAWQWVFSESTYVDRCAPPTQTYLMEYFMPTSLVDRTAFSSLYDVSIEDQTAGFAENIYYAPSKAYATIAFRSMMGEMKRWITQQELLNRCVCFFHFGVGIRGGFYKNTFFIRSQTLRASEEKVSVTIGRTGWIVPERASIEALGDTSCVPVEVKTTKEANACLAYCSH